MGYSYEQLKQMGATPGPAVSPTTPTATTPKKKYTYAELQKLGATTAPNQTVPATPQPTQENTPGFFGKMISPLATMVARPFQAGAELMGASPESVDKFTNKYTGGVVAPVPQNASDVIKDVGRAAQTVAFGAGPSSMLSSGAAFGLGSSLEQQGSDVFSGQGLTKAATDTLIGMGAGKLLDKFGSPIINKVGQTIGSWTPQFALDLASKGAGAVSKFMAEHELPGAISQVSKPLSEKITSGMEGIDTGVNKLFTGGKSKIANAITSQYPGLKKGSIQEHYINVDKKNMTQPALENKPAYNEAKDIYNSAKANGVDIPSEAIDSGIYHDSIVSKGSYDTTDTSKMIRKQNGQSSEDMLKPILDIADRSVPPTPLKEIEQKAIDSVMKDIKIADKEAEIAKITRRFGSTGRGSLQERYPNGMNLKDIQREKIAAAGSTNFDNPDKNVNFHASNAYRSILEDKFPPITDPATGKVFDIRDFNKQLQKKYNLADYLEALNGKKVPVGTVKQIFKLGGKLAGAYGGSSLGGALGGVVGYHMGGTMAGLFENMSNPVKKAYLDSIEHTSPEVFRIFSDYIKTTDANLYKILALPAPKTPGEMIRQTGVNTIPNRFDKTIEMGAPTPKPITQGERMANDAKQNSRFLNSTKQLPAPEPRMITPNTQGTPNQPGIDYGTNREPGGMYQRIFKGGGPV